MTKKNDDRSITINELHIHIDNKLVIDTVLGVETRIRQRLDRIEEHMAKSKEVQDMETAVNAALEDITTDIQTLLTRSTGLSDEDKAALVAITDKAKAVAAIFSPTPGGDPV